MIRVAVKFKAFSITVDVPRTSIQIVVGVSTHAVFFRQRFGTEFAVGLCLVQFDDPLLAILKTGTMLAQFVFNFSLRQNKSGGRFFALRSVNMFDLLGFGGDGSIQKT